MCDYVGRRTTVSLYRVYLCVTLLVSLCYPVGYALCDYAGNSSILHMVYLCVTFLVTLCYPVGYALCDMLAGEQQFHTIQSIFVRDLVGYSVLPNWLCFDYAGNSFILYRVYLCVTLLDTLCYPVGYTLCDYVGRRMTVSY